MKPRKPPPEAEHIDGVTASRLRKERGESQEVFWRRVFVSQPYGSRVEAGLLEMSDQDRAVFSMVYRIGVWR